MHPEWHDDLARVPYSALERNRDCARWTALEVLDRAKDTYLGFQYAEVWHQTRLMEVDLLFVEQQARLDRFDAPAARKQAWEDVLSTGVKREQDWHIQCIANSQRAAEAWRVKVEQLEFSLSELATKRRLYESNYESDYEQDAQGRRVRRRFVSVEM